MIRTLVSYILVFYQLLAFCFGWYLCRRYGCSGYSRGENRMRAKLLLDLLQIAPENRLEIILDFCFFIISDKETEVPQEVLPEILEHLEKRIGGTETMQPSEWFRTLTRYEFRRYCDALLDSDPRRRKITLEDQESWNIPTVERPMGFEKEIARVQKRIEEYKKGISSSRAMMVENFDLEKGL
ncbi:hypothetical protein BCON_0457g00050 [Botryotinia convoluta]|uniref:Uncharacterized protein n=1 Tax=Botryotinia convoluta TaxID=54673 RepID=A0A4Z1H6T1_9HELO|nr:hypothetical protein BCON_0457g00050 [Botryotinia convoluta]